MDSISKYVYDFEVYCGKNVGGQDELQPNLGVTNSAYGVVMGLLGGLHG